MKKNTKASKADFHAYNSRLQPFAHALRMDMTKAECCLWKYVLRARGMKGFQFRRQRPVGKYIADFMCKELMLVLEVDGITHQFEETVEKDKRKDSDLSKLGFTVLRFTDDEVLNDIEWVAEEIEYWIETHITPPPAPPPAGDITV